MNLASLVADLMAAEGFNGLMVRVREYTVGELAGVSDEEWQRSLAEKHSEGWTVVDLTGRKNVERVDEAGMAAANASTVAGRAEAMRASAADEAPEPARSLDCYRFVDLLQREHRPAAAITDNQILD
jgi:hypothetical protein